jgi:hypothetical protein
LISTLTPDSSRFLPAINSETLSGDENRFTVEGEVTSEGSLPPAAAEEGEQLDDDILQLYSSAAA